MVRPVLSILCLLGPVAVALADQPWPMNHRSMQIPIKVEAARRAEIKELALFYSTDQGRTWGQGGVATPEQEAFTFTAPSDGLYWFSLMITKRDGTREPATPNNLPPSMKVIIDTTKPVARITSAERQGEEIAMAWQVQDAAPDWATFKLEYRTADMPALMWAPVPAKAAATGQARFRPSGNGAVTMRLQVKDQAGNEAAAQKEVPGGGTIMVSTASGATPATPPAPEPPLLVGTQGSSGPPLVPPGGNTATPVPPPAAPPAAPRDIAPPPAPSPRDVSSPFEQAGQPLRQAASRGPTPAGIDRSLIQPPANQSTADSGNRVVAATPDGQTPPTPATGGPASRSPAPQPAGVMLSNSLQVSLDYEVNKVGPSGVGNVELYLTRDQGATWERFADDADLKPPMVVDLPGEGIFGLALVVRSKAGLGRRAPPNGEKPQMVIEVDTTAPEAKLYAPTPVRGQREQLVVSWEAQDKNLVPNPVTLEWAERQGGPWQPIGVDLPNTGRHTWKLPPSLPYHVFMRLMVRDAAGNVSVAETDRPVLVDLSEPEAVITTIKPVPVGQR